MSFSASMFGPAAKFGPAILWTSLFDPWLSMAPKKKTSTSADEEPGYNQQLFQEVDDALKIIYGHDLFVDVKEAEALGVGSRLTDDAKRRKKSIMGTQAAFSSDEFKSAMTQGGGVYRCAGNEFWLDPFFSLTGNIPINRKDLENLMETSFAEPDSYVGTTVVLVDSKTMDPMAQKGALKRLSPEEVWLAKMLRLAQVIKDGADDETLLKWKASMVGASWQFGYYEKGWAKPTDAALPRAISLREQMVAEGIAVGRDVVQRIFEVHKTRKALEAHQGGARVSNDKMAEYYKQRITLNPRAEKVTSTFVESASFIYASILKEPEFVRILQKMSERFGQEHPLNSSAKLRLVANRACKKTRTLSSPCRPSTT